ncbi:probable trehalose-phosphate phosphatase 2 [Amaranthus tricolor]|uniref:probable trehalose-phosphate phosphatase 2 n=1 Tax=Amaranthus tricolor TaxID=29722 RepID=UPI0025906B8F|nr:probable trehalose-phosphate phosphatase 2 [Amaranthus tricolor]
MIKNKLIKVSNALGFLRYSSNPQTPALNIRNERSSMVRPEPCDQNPTTPNAVDTNYEEWLSDHPSALNSFQKMMSIAKGKNVVMFLDYDGTLSPIVDDPELAFMSDKMRSAVSEVAKHFPTAIISGRSRDKVYDFVKLNDIYYAGSHGMDIMTPPGKHKSSDGKYQTTLAVDKKGNEANIFQPAQEFLPEILEIFNELEEETKAIQGVTVEDNRFCISVHLRRAKVEDHSLVKEKVKSIVAKHSGFHLTTGRKVLEVRPPIKWNKGNALEYLLDTLGFSESSDVVPIYIGDDATDEDAFKVIQKRGQGFPIIVSLKPKQTAASYSLRDPSEVLTFLLRLSKWPRNSS